MCLNMSDPGVFEGLIIMNLGHGQECAGARETKVGCGPSTDRYRMLMLWSALP